MTEDVRSIYGMDWLGDKRGCVNGWLSRCWVRDPAEHPRPAGPRAPITGRGAGPLVNPADF